LALFKRQNDWTEIGD